MLTLTRLCPTLCRRSLPLAAPQRHTAARMKKPTLELSDGPTGAGPVAPASPYLSVFEGLRGSLDDVLLEMSAPSHRDHNEDPMATDSKKSAHTPSKGRKRESFTFPSYYIPMDLREIVYEGSLAEELRMVAKARRFRSPVWATKNALVRAGYTLKEGEETGVNVSTDTCFTSLYNLEQTDATVAVVEGYMKNWNARGPLNAMGRSQTSAVRELIQKHPNYKLYGSCIWLTETEASIMGTAVAEDQKDRGIIIPSTTRDVYGVPQSTEPFVLFNAEQLEDPQMVTQETCEPIDCLYPSGKWYNVTQSVGMRQYCRKYGLSMKPAAVFISQGHLRSLGGYLLPKALRSDYPEAIKPFVCVMRDDVVTLYHMELTNMPDELLNMALKKRKALLDCLKAVSIKEGSESV